MKVISLNSLAVGTVLLLASVISTPVKAEDTVCYGPYGEVIECPVVNKSFKLEKGVVDGDVIREEVRGLKAATNVEFQLIVTNTGELDVTSLVIVDNLPVNLRFISLSDSDGNTVVTSVENNSVRWTIEALDAGESLTYAFVGRTNAIDIAPGTEKCVTNVANVLYRGDIEAANTASVCITGGDVEGEKTTPTPAVLPDTDLSNTGIVGFAMIVGIIGLLLLNVSKLTELLFVSPKSRR